MSMMNANAAATTAMTANEPLDLNCPKWAIPISAMRNSLRTWTA